MEFGLTRMSPKGQAIIFDRINRIIQDSQDWEMRA